MPSQNPLRNVDPGFSRREFLELVAIGGGAAIISGCEGRPGRTGAPERPAPPPLVKDPAPFIQHGANLETRLENLRGLITPNELFFVRNNAPTPRLDAATYRLRVEGDAVEQPIELSYEDVLRLPSRSLVAYLECAGNWRGFFQKLMGRAAEGTQWGTGGVSCAEWIGTPLAEVLRLAGIRRNAVDVNLSGLDQAGFSRPMPVSKAMDDSTILAYAMNGETLPADHGFPVRAVVSGWVGSNSVKWLGRIEVASRKIWVKNNTTSYVMIGPDWPKEKHAPAEGGPITSQTIKSTLALPWPARLRPGPQVIRGVAHSPHGAIRRVLWDADQRSTWQPARMVSPILPNAWAWFEFTWEATPGSHALMTRASDVDGNTQPLTAPFNEKGYLLNVVLPHPVEVA
jgi:sulfane dehydrogenase subunit SoxC